MRISCPNCTASFQVADGALGATGRKVRCAKCGNVWHAMPGAAPDDEEEFPGVPEGQAPRAPIREPTEDDWRAALSDPGPVAAKGDEAEDGAAADGWGDAPQDARQDEDAADAAFEAAAKADAADGGFEGGLPDDEDPRGAGFGMPEASGAEKAEMATIDARPKGFEDDADKPLRRAKKKKPEPKRRINLPRVNYAPPPIVAWAIAAGVVLVVLGGGVLLRESVVRTFPDFADLFAGIGLPVNLRGLEFEEVRTYREVDGATPVLVVDGMVRSIDPTDERSVGQIRFSLISAAGREVYAWTMDPARSSLKPGETIRFKSRLAAPPEAAVDVMVRFVDRRGP